MDKSADLLRTCKSYINCQFREAQPKAGEPPRPFVTISRQAGAGGITIARLVGDILRQHDKHAKCSCPWTVFDKNLVTEVLKKNELPERLGEFMNEEKISEVDDILGELFRLHPAKWTLVEKTSQTILQLAQLGYVIIVGRGSNVLTRQLKGGFHVRLIGSVEKRQKHLEEYYGFKPKQASEFLKSEDEGRKNYLKSYFGANVDDPLLYDMVLNTDFIPYEEAARIVSRAAAIRYTKSHPVLSGGQGSQVGFDDWPY